MGAYFIRRILIAIPTIFLVTFVVFILIVGSGDPLAQVRSKPNVSPQTIAQLENEYHLKDPILKRYFLWLGDLAQGDFGTSFTTQEPVSNMLAKAFGATSLLVAGWLLLSGALAISVGVYSGTKPYTWGDYTLTGVSFIGFSAPVFFWAILLQVYLALGLSRVTGIKLFYVYGMNSPGEAGNWINILQHLALPVLAISIATVASWSRYLRSSMLEAMRSDYIRTAKAKGLKRSTIVFKHAFRNATIPLLTLMAVDIGAFFGGAIVTETIFGWPGMGQLFFTALSNSDFPVIMSWLVVVTIFVVVFNLVADMLYAVMDPRIRYE